MNPLILNTAEEIKMRLAVSQLVQTEATGLVVVFS
jgi:hypothetical protein